MRIIVESHNDVISSHSEDGRYGSWSKEYRFRIDDVRVDTVDEELDYGEDGFVLPDDTDTAYVLSMTYTSGDSFGSETGRGTVIHLFADYDLAVSVLKKFQENPDEYSIAFKDDFGRDIKIGNPAAGYFERIEEMSIEPWPLQARRRKMTVTF